MGGPERTFTFTRKELAELHDAHYWSGFDFGVEQTEKALRAEIRDELLDELVDPDCPMCKMRQELRQAQQEIAAAKARYDELKGRARHAVSREGGAFKYRDTIGAGTPREEQP